MMGRGDEAKRRGGRGGWLLGAIVGAPLLFYGVASLLARPAAERPVFERLTARPLVIAHRGGGAVARQHAVRLREICRTGRGYAGNGRPRQRRRRPRGAPR
ncbi:MAG: hypothetical protein R2873_04925 [Caldilineaceae bacterium]